MNVPSDIKPRFDALLVKKQIPAQRHNDFIESGCGIISISAKSIITVNEKHITFLPAGQENFVMVQQSG